MIDILRKLKLLGLFKWGNAAELDSELPGGHASTYRLQCGGRRLAKGKRVADNCPVPSETCSTDPTIGTRDPV